MKVRQSTLAQFGRCARQYYYATVVGVGDKDQSGSLTVFGSVFHYAAEVYETYGYDLDLAKRTFNYYWANPEALGYTIDFWHNRTNFDMLLKRGGELLDKLHELAFWQDDGRLVGNEINFTVPIGEHELTGTIDRLWVRPGQKLLQVQDYKTASQVPRNLKFHIQPTAYCYATTTFEFWDQLGTPELFEEYKDYKRQGWWYHARDGKWFNAGYRGGVDYARLLLAIDQMDRAVQSGVFPLDISGDSCGWCAFADGICGSEFQPLFIKGSSES